MSGTQAQTVERKLLEIIQEHRSLQERLSGLEDKIAAFKLVITECAENPDELQDTLPAPSPTLPNGSLEVDNLRGMRLEEALVTYAECHGAEINSYDARPFLIDAGLLRGESRSTSSQLYEALSNSKRFEQSDRKGRWRLVYGAAYEDVPTAL